MDNGNNDGSGSGEKQNHRLPLSDVVSDCLRMWFQDTLKEAKAGDLSVQVLVAQMYYNGYGIPKDAQKFGITLWKNKCLLNFSVSSENCGCVAETTADPAFVMIPTPFDLLNAAFVWEINEK